MIMKNVEAALLNTKLDILNKGTECAFYSKILFALKTVYTDEVPYAAVDGLRLYINPEKFLELPKDQAIFLLCHEAMHIALMHMFRIGERNHLLWNYAGDYVINYHLNKNEFSLIPNCLYNSDYRDMTTEEIYEILKNQVQQDLSNVLGSDIKTPQVGDDEDLVEVQEEVARVVESAVNSATPGSIPGELARFFEERRPKVPWQVVLQRYLTSFNKPETNWNRRNRRFRNYMPTPFVKSVGTISFAVDTSGSVSDELFNNLMSEIVHVFKQCKPELIELILFDHILQSVDQIRNEHELKEVSLKGGGGTSVDEVMEYFNNNSTSNLLCILTDGYLDTSPECHKNLLWIVYNNPEFTAEQGEVIHVTVAE